jgi:hypothetical protein
VLALLSLKQVWVELHLCLVVLVLLVVMCPSVVGHQLG